MTNETKNFIIEHDVADRFIISIKYTDGKQYVAQIDNCHLSFFGSSLQNCITSWDLYTEFIKIVDEIFDYFTLKENDDEWLK